MLSARIMAMQQQNLLNANFAKDYGLKDYGLRLLSLLHQEGYINGEWVGSSDGKKFPVKNPANGEVIGSVPDMDKKEVQTALDSAYNAFQTWSITTARERSGLLRRWFNLMEEHKEDLSRIVTIEAGKSLAESRAEVTYGNSFLEWYAEESKRIYGEVVQSPSASKEMIFLREPIGVVSLITPWNFPSAMVTRKAAAALAAGCTCVIKPAEDTPFSALAAADLAEQAGFPPGVINVITTSRPNAQGVGEVMCQSPKVAGVSFTGSSAVGELLYRQCASGIKKIILELGGNAPFIVFNSADLTRAVEGLMAAKFRNTGQACISANRIFIQSGIYDRFLATFKEEVSKRLVMGNGLDEGVNLGTIINENQLQRLERIVTESVEKGAKIVLGGKRHSLGGLFYEPTLLVNVTEDMSCFKEEIFGPVAAIKKFETEEEVIKMANNSDYGLAAYFFSQDISQVWRVSRRIETGMIGINEGLITCAEGAMGGIKKSGIGKEGSKHGIDDYTHIKYLCIGGLQ